MMLGGSVEDLARVLVPRVSASVENHVNNTTTGTVPPQVLVLVAFCLQLIETLRTAGLFAVNLGRPLAPRTWSLLKSSSTDFVASCSLKLQTSIYIDPPHDYYYRNTRHHSGLPNPPPP